MHKLIADLLDLTRIESGQRNRQLAPVDLCGGRPGRRGGRAAEAAARNIALRPHADGAGPDDGRRPRNGNDLQQLALQRREVQPRRRQRGRDACRRGRAGDDRAWPTPASA